MSLFTKLTYGVLGLIMLVQTSATGVATPIFPPSLKKGDMIAIVAPGSYPQEDQPKIEQCVAALHQRGYRVRVASNLNERYGYLAGTDASRAKAFMDCWLDPQVKAVWCYRGGYGCNRILSLLDFEAIRANPKIFIGMSDATVLHHALQQKAQLVSFLGPNANLVLNDKKELHPFSEQWLWIALQAGEEGRVGYRFSFSPQHNEEQAKAIRPGSGRGRLTGGNLAVIAGMVGTPWQIETKGTILVLEDINEEPYKIDRMLYQLREAGLLQDLAGLILSSWHRCRSDDPTKSFSLEQVFAEYFGNAAYPVLYGFPSGHIEQQTTLPLGVLAELDVDQKSLILLENPVLD